MCLLVTCMSLVKCMLISSAYFYLDYLFFGVVICSLYVLDTNPLLDIAFVNILSHLWLSFCFIDGFLHCAKGFY